MARIQLRFYGSWRTAAEAKMARDQQPAAVHQILILPKVKVFIQILCNGEVFLKFVIALNSSMSNDVSMCQN